MSAKIGTSIAARILGWNEDTILKWRKLGKLKTGTRKSKAPQSPWEFDREEIIQIKNANQPK